jgi:hypothetical protein
MDILLNDLSFHGQFQSIPEFEVALDKVMAMRGVARKYGRVVKVHRRLDSAITASGLTFQQVVGRISRERKAALLAWLTREGPFWQDSIRHTGDDYLDCDGEIVTNTAIAECACGIASGLDTCLVSLDPSAWTRTPLRISHEWTDFPEPHIEVRNFWSAPPFETHLQAARKVMRSWADLEEASRAFCGGLRFTTDCFKPLFKHPFGAGPAGEIFRRLEVMNSLVNATVDGERTEEGDRIYQAYFVGEKAWFSD